MKTATRQDIIKLGFSRYYADKIFKECKALLVTNGYSFYRNNKIKRIPVSVIEEVLHISWEDEY
ncbi:MULTISPECIES: DUF3173 domain-containing protein [Enterococcus]|uniref:DUF3173 domain-containing protein n=1 Tax=Enterococcus TaxID=1350 RepID=UPI0003309E24|nr:DUF3173 domain-containing protein [Enterococcus casseliflavus]EOH83637.1 hypothetical protein UAM_01061 [Enterococcus casseliflavus ATCC 49996]EOU11132.1 hypothetical protein I582_01647 [Enterococcus casseliflavus ATCC 49996]MBE9879293.1 DUF3173 family protein [Enterococcus casseliflavus]MDT2962921.1 DUF3173 domain-containing protein [Enterococcus casseliflavus]QQB84955.1 DUF3173 domain-containing protein [Enterococcus casseliflavus]